MPRSTNTRDSSQTARRILFNEKHRISGYYGYNREQIEPADGSSKTLLVGEMLGGRSNGAKEYSASWLGVGAMPTAGGMRVVNASWFQYSSNHPGIVHFCFADGSVRGLNPGSTAPGLRLFRGPYSEDWYVFQQLSGFRDGGIRDPSSLMQ
jgi:hypothetical protein